MVVLIVIVVLIAIVIAVVCVIAILAVPIVSIVNLVAIVPIASIVAVVSVVPVVPVVPKVALVSMARSHRVIVLLVGVCRAGGGGDTGQLVLLGQKQCSRHCPYADCRIALALFACKRRHRRCDGADAE